MPFDDYAEIRPGSIRDDVRLPRRQQYRPPRRSWRDEVLYFLLVDRFSDGREVDPPLDRDHLGAARPDVAGQPWRWDSWWRSGRDRWQGGTLTGVRSKLGYLEDLGVTAIWLSPVFKQRAELDTYHGYGIQDFLDVDPRLGTRRDLVDLVDAAHARGMRILLDVIFNHSGTNWVYPGGARRMPYTSERYAFGSWLDGTGQPVPAVGGPDDGAWPSELQDAEAYTRAGSANLSEGTDIEVVLAEHKRGDFEELRDFDLGHEALLQDLARCYEYWIALTGCDGFRIDTMKHVAFDDARNFCGAIKEYAQGLGIDDFFLLAEVAGGDKNAARYLDAVGRNLDAALDIDDGRTDLAAVAKGLAAPREYLDQFIPGLDELGSHRFLGGRHVAVVDDHDHVSGEKLRFSADSPPGNHQVVVATAIQLLTLGIPCLYYGTEQGFSGPEPEHRRWLDGWGSHDEYLREAMFGPAHPRAAGVAGRDGALDTALPGFGPFGTAGEHCFDQASPTYRRIRVLTGTRAQHPVLRYGRQYERELRRVGAGSGPLEGFRRAEAGDVVTWSRILDVEEAVVAANPVPRTPDTPDPTATVDVTVDAALNGYPGATFTVVAATADAGGPAVGSVVPVQWQDGRAYVRVAGLGPCEVVVLVNRPSPDDGVVVEH